MNHFKILNVFLHNKTWRYRAIDQERNRTYEGEIKGKLTSKSTDREKEQAALDSLEGAKRLEKITYITSNEGIPKKAKPPTSPDLHKARLEQDEIIKEAEEAEKIRVKAIKEAEEQTNTEKKDGKD